MLTTKTIAASQGSSYYTQENYYTADELEERSQWLGEGAAKLGLKGQVQAEDFQQLLEGNLPTGERFRLRKPTRAGYQERAGLDCTFSAPKSISLLALVKGDRQLVKAHREAVSATLKLMEDRYAGTRQRLGDGSRRVVKTGNLVVAQFHHDTTRETDPHLHTHCVLINATQTGDGRWYSLRNDEIVRYKKLLGAVYQNELALRVRSLGYEVESRGQGQFEVQGFSEAQLAGFSQRRQQILAQVDASASWAERDAAWEKTRKAKGKPKEREELRDRWRQQADALGVEFPTRRRQHLTLEPQADLAEQLVADGIRHCSERRTAFPIEAVERFALERVGQVSVDELATAVARNPDLIYLDKGVTTQEAVLRELDALKLMRAGRGQFAPICADAAQRLDTFAARGVELTAGQRQAVELAATSRDAVVGWQGVAGAGKTFALQQVKELVVTSGHQLYCFAPSAEAAKVLEAELGVEGTTVRYLLDTMTGPGSMRLSPHNRRPLVPQPEVWVVDEVGMLSARDAQLLLQRAKERGARLLLVGDTRQNSAVEAGNPFKSLQQGGMATAYLNQSLRQKTPELQQAVDLVAKGKVDEGYALLSDAGYVRQVAPDDLVGVVARDYLALDKEAQEKTLVIAERHVERRALTKAIREGLKTAGELTGERQGTALVAKNLTRVQERYGHHFAAGEVVVPLRDYQRLRLTKGERYEVMAVAGDALVLQGREGEELRVDPARFQKSAYQLQSLAVAMGDKLRWTRNDRRRGRRNGQEVVVTAIDNGRATVVDAKGRVEAIDLKEPQHLDHAWVKTTYGSQGKTADRAFVVAGPGTSKESFYVGISRVKRDLRIYTPDRTALQRQVNESRAQVNPLEMMPERQAEEQTVREVAEGRGAPQESALDYVRRVTRKHGQLQPDGSYRYLKPGGQFELISHPNGDFVMQRPNGGRVAVAYRQGQGAAQQARALAMLEDIVARARDKQQPTQAPKRSRGMRL